MHCEYFSNTEQSAFGKVYQSLVPAFTKFNELSAANFFSSKVAIINENNKQVRYMSESCLCGVLACLAS